MVANGQNFCAMWQFKLLICFIVAGVGAKQGSKPLALGEDDWSRMLEGEWLVKFYAPWCPACKAVAPTWDAIAGWSEDLDIKVADVDVTDSAGLSGRFLVTALPTIYHVKDGQFRVYRGARDEGSLISFVDDKKWQEVEPLPWYYSPTAIHMSALAQFFKLSIAIRDLHSTITSEYGIPVWGSYVMFAVATIIVGLILGLVIVFLCDAVYPPRPPAQYRGQATGAGADPHAALHSDDMDNESDILDDRPPRDDDEDDEGEEEEEEKRTDAGGDAPRARRRNRPTTD